MNSSPPKRASKFSASTHPASRRATSTRRQSPRTWPMVSLTRLKPSRSRNSTATRSVRPAGRARDWRSRSSKRARFGRWVSGSCTAWCASLASSALRWVTSRVTPAERIASPSGPHSTTRPTSTSQRMSPSGRTTRYSRSANVFGAGDAAAGRRHPLAVVRMDEGGAVGGAGDRSRLRRQSEQGRHRRRPGDLVAGDVPVPGADGGRLQRQPQPLFACPQRRLGALAIGDVEEDPLPVPGPTGRVPHQHRVVADPDPLARPRPQAVLERERLAGLVRPVVGRFRPFAVVRVDAVKKERRVVEPLRRRAAEDLADLGADVEQPAVVAAGLGVGDRRDLLDQGAVAGLHLVRRAGRRHRPGSPKLMGRQPCQPRQGGKRLRPQFHRPCGRGRRGRRRPHRPAGSAARR